MATPTANSRSQKMATQKHAEFFKDNVLESAWFWGNLTFIACYLLSLLKSTGVLPIKKRAMHILSCSSLIAAYGSCVYSKNRELVLERLIKDGNFRCLLVFCSLLTLHSAIIPMFPFFIMSILALSTHVLKNRKIYEGKGFFFMCKFLVSRKDEAVLFAYKLEVLCVPLLLAYLLIGSADLFSAVSYAGMVWFEYNHNPLMRKAISELRANLDSIAFSPSVPAKVREKYVALRDLAISRFAYAGKKKPE